METGMEKRSLTAEEFDEKIVPLLNTIAELVISHPEIPDDTSQSDLLGTLQTMKTELEYGVRSKVPEITRLNDELSKKNKQITNLQNTNQELFLRVGAKPDPANKQKEDDRPKRTWADIRNMMDALPTT